MESRRQQPESTAPMKINQHSKNIVKHLRSLEERMNKLGVMGDPLYQFDLEMCFSPIGHVARKFIVKLDRKLNRRELNEMLHKDETIPIFDFESSIEIGKTVNQGLSFRVPITKAVHWLVVGSSGAGKTNLFCVVEKAVRNVIPCTLIDHKNEGARFIHAVPNAAYIPIDKQRWNLLAGVGNQTDYIRYLSDQLAKLMDLVRGTRNAVLAKLLSLCSNKDTLPSISDLAELFRILAQQENRNNLNTAARGFEDLAAAIGRWADVRAGKWPFVHMLNVIPMKDVPPSLEFLYISMLLKHMTDRASLNGHSTTLCHFLFFDEALNWMGKEMEPPAGSGRTNQVATMMRISRSYGFAILAAVQSLSMVQDAVVDNAGIFIVFRVNSVKDAKHICRRLGFDESRFREIMNLETGMAYVSMPNSEPIKIRVPFVDLGDYPSEADIRKRMAPLWAQWDNETVFAPTKVKEEATIDFREILGEKPSDIESTEELAEPASSKPVETTPSTAHKPSDPLILSEYFELLRSCKAHPVYGASSHYQALGWSGGRGNRVKNKLLELGWIEAVRISSPKGGRPKETLCLLPAGWEVLNESA
jgi:hypothetical protein